MIAPARAACAAAYLAPALLGLGLATGGPAWPLALYLLAVATIAAA